MAPPSPCAVTAAGEQGGAARPRFEVADVVRAYADEYLRTHPATIEQRKVLRAIAACRTAALGGHVEQCDACGQRRIAYDSCRNRHCPKCQGKQCAQWMAAEQAMLLPVPYFHVVFTLPHVLNPLMRVNRDLLYDLLLRIAARTLSTFARDPRHLGAEPSVTMVLHTWGQTLEEHYHVHCVVSGGGLSPDGRWVSLPRAKNKRRRVFLFHVGALSRVFRGKFIAALERARRCGKLRYLGHSATLAEAGPWQDLRAKLYTEHWVVYCKPPFGGPAQVLKYLSRYTHRVAISNHRILCVANGVVRFEYRDYADHNQRKQMSLPATEFLRRFLQHVVPKGFMRIRHYGITANCRRRQKLARCRELLEPAQRTATSESNVAGTDSCHDPAVPLEPKAASCPSCGGRMSVIEILAPTTAPHDTS